MNRSASKKIQQWTTTLPLRSELHLVRKIWHMSMGLLIVSLYIGGFPVKDAAIILGSLLALELGVEVTRLRNPKFNDFFCRSCSLLLRSNEVNGISGVPYYIASALFAIVVFPKPIAVLSLLFLALGDPIASLVGILFKGRTVQIIKGKSLHGSMAAYAVCAMATWFYLKSTGMGGIDLIRLTLLGGFAGALAEILPLEIDDNFTIPVVSGFILWAGFIAVNFT